MKRFCGIVAVLLGVCGWLSAQELPKVEIFGGYSYTHAGIKPGTAVNANGYAASATGNVNRLLGITVEVSQQFGSSGSTTDYEFRSFMVGPQLSSRKHEKFTPFAHILIGDARYGSRQVPDVAKQRYHENTFAIAAGGGLDYNFHPSVAVRLIQLDYFTTKFSRDRQNDLRLGFGVVFKFGHK